MKSHVQSQLIARPETASEQPMADAARIMHLMQQAEEFGTWRFDVATGHCWWSPTVYRIHGLPPEDGPVNLEDAIRAYHRDDARTVAWLIERAMVDQTGFSFVLRLKRSDGKMRLVESVASVTVDESGRTQDVFGIFRDVSDRYTERDLARTRGMLVRSFIANSPAPIVVTDRQMRYLEVSPSWVSFHGLKERKSLIGKCHYDVLPEVPAEWRKEHRAALAGAVIKRKKSLNKRNGSAVNKAQQAGSVVFPWHGPDGRVGGLIIMVTTLDDEKSATETPQRLSQLFANGVAHPCEARKSA